MGGGIGRGEKRYVTCMAIELDNARTLAAGEASRSRRFLKRFGVAQPACAAHRCRDNDDIVFGMAKLMAINDRRGHARQSAAPPASAIVTEISCSLNAGGRFDVGPVRIDAHHLLMREIAIAKDYFAARIDSHHLACTFLFRLSSSLLGRLPIMTKYSRDDGSACLQCSRR